MSVDDQKRRAAAAALERVEDGMRLGLGSGSTSAAFVDLLGARVKDGLRVVGVPTSQAIKDQAEALGIPLSTLDEEPFVDIAIDGTDEIDGEMRLIKGGGGALLREKIVANASDQLIIIADTSKKVDTLGAFKLPIEVVRFGIHVSRNMIEVLGREAGCDGEIVLRRDIDGKPFVTDNGNLILDCDFGRIEEPELLAAALQMVPGLVDHGLFLGLADVALIADDSGVEEMIAEAFDDDDDTENGPVTV
ncbi:MAG: ribose-5-phosphate isomerase RpiA [Pseudomonadota bacterium]